MKKLMIKAGVYCFLISLAGCATQAPTKELNTEQKVTDAAISPLKDLNLIKQKFPEVIVVAKKEGLSEKNKEGVDLSCEDISKELADLTVHLGLLPGENDKDSQKEKTLAQKGGAEAEKLVVSTIKTTTDVIPFKSLIKRLSGATKAEEEARQLLDSARLRKAYLLGLKAGKSCKE